MIAENPVDRRDRKLKPELQGTAKRKPTWSIADNGMRLGYWRNRWSEVWEAEDFRRRSHYFTVAAGDHIAATGKFEEWDNSPEYVGSLVRFVQAADIHSQEAYDVANALFASFCRVETKTGLWPMCYGSIVSFERLRIEKASAQQSGTIWALINRIIARMRRNGVAGMILKAFPLEYEGEVTEQNREAFERRQRALMRHYVCRLSVRTLPGWPGRGGWQWLALACTLEPLASRRTPRM
jgi:hypothetical protein